MLRWAIAYVATLTPYRILMTRVFASTNSALLAVLMHASYTGWQLTLYPATLPNQSLVWQSAFAAALWIAAAIVLRTSPHPTQAPPQTASQQGVTTT